MVNVTIVRPKSSGPGGGNLVTALRWAESLRRSGLTVGVTESWEGQETDVLFALHAEKSLPSIRGFARAHPDRPIVIACSGTDLYGENRPSPAVVEALDLAARIIVLQPRGLEVLPERCQERARVIYQSVEPIPRSAPRADRFDVCVLAHLRPVKNPLLAAQAARLLPAGSRIHVSLAGGVRSAAAAQEARREVDANPRFEWLGELTHAQSLELLASSRMLVSTSWHEGGANVISEALAAGVPILATDIPGTTGLLGEEHAGIFPAGDAQALAELLLRAERDPAFVERLRLDGQSRAWITSPELERDSLRALLEELLPPASDSVEAHAL